MFILTINHNNPIEAKQFLMRHDLLQKCCELYKSRDSFYAKVAFRTKQKALSTRKLATEAGLEAHCHRLEKS